jgi:hypothetical protein
MMDILIFTSFFFSFSSKSEINLDSHLCRYSNVVHAFLIKSGFYNDNNNNKINKSNNNMYVCIIIIILLLLVYIFFFLLA